MRALINFAFIIGNSWQGSSRLLVIFHDGEGWHFHCGLEPGTWLVQTAAPPSAGESSVLHDGVMFNLQRSAKSNATSMIHAQRSTFHTAVSIHAAGH
jgi:hypothetical protein